MIRVYEFDWVEAPVRRIVAKEYKLFVVVFEPIVAEEEFRIKNRVWTHSCIPL